MESNETVTVGLADGRTFEGNLKHFSPLLPTVTLLSQPGEATSEHRSKDVAFVAFHAKEGTTPRPAVPGMEKFLVETVSGPRFDVHVSGPAMENPIGFFAYELSSQRRFDRIFFFNHGLRMKPSREPVGQVLVKAGVVRQEDIDAALDQQAQGRKAKLGEILLEKNAVTSDALEQGLKLPRGKFRLGEVLVEAGLITSAQVESALAEQRQRRGRRLGEVLVDMGLITEDALVRALATKFHMQVVDLERTPPTPEALRELSREVIAMYRCLPVETNAQTLTVAIADPLSTEIADALRFRSGKRIIEVLANPTQINARVDAFLESTKQEKPDTVLQRAVGGTTTSEPESLTLVAEAVDLAGDEVDSSLSELVSEAGAAPIVRLVNQIIVEALDRNASDVHLLPQARGLVVMHRIDGDLREHTVLDRRIQRQVISRLKIVCGMNIAERRLPQDGRVLLQHHNKDYELRLSNIPNSFGESMVARVLNKEVSANLEALGLLNEDRQRLLLITERSYGLILVTGPTGSGKSTTLFALLNEVRKRPLHVITIEDPIESNLTGVNQIQVNPKIDLSFARVLRNILRHDPDVIMVGEMRDRETATIGVEAALTGHLMLSTLHTNTAIDTVMRLSDLGVPTYQVSSALLGIVSQELVKRLCPHCRKPTKPSDTLLALLDRAKLNNDGTFYDPVGCGQCGGTGFKGRALLYELFPGEVEVREAMRRQAPASEIETIARRYGFVPKRQRALDLARDGVICAQDLLAQII